MHRIYLARSVLLATQPAIYPECSNVTSDKAKVTSTVATKGKTSRFYRPELDAIRFFLFLGVLFHHSVDNAHSQSWAHFPLLASCINAIHDAAGFCLSFFFFLSSYLITCLLQIERQRTGTLDLKSFYLRRVLRLWPLYMGYIALACVLHLFDSSGYPASAGSIVALLLFSGNWYWILHGSFPGLMFFHLWSISVEEQFYVLFPFLARKVSMIRLQQICAAVCVLSLVSTWTLVSLKSPVIHIWANSFVESIFFASGILFALRSPLGERKVSGSHAAAGILGGASLWFLAQMGGVTNLASTLHPWSATLAYLTADLGCVLVLWGTLRVPSSWLPKPVVYLGRVTYGLYVFHMLMIYLVRTYFSPHVHIPAASLAMELLLCIAVGTISYEFYEKPFLKLKHRFELVHSRVA